MQIFHWKVDLIGFLVPLSHFQSLIKDHLYGRLWALRIVRCAFAYRTTGSSGVFASSSRTTHKNTQSCLFHPIHRGSETQVTSTNSLINRMKLEDFCRFYSDLDICCPCPDFLDDDASCHWKTYRYEGRWVAGMSAGGCLNNIGTFYIY